MQQAHDFPLFRPANWLRLFSPVNDLPDTPLSQAVGCSQTPHAHASMVSVQYIIVTHMAAIGANIDCITAPVLPSIQFDFFRYLWRQFRHPFSCCIQDIVDDIRIMRHCYARPTDQAVKAASTRSISLSDGLYDGASTLAI